MKIYNECDQALKVIQGFQTYQWQILNWQRNQWIIQIMENENNSKINYPFINSKI